MSVQCYFYLQFTKTIPIYINVYSVALASKLSRKWLVVLKQLHKIKEGNDYNNTMCYVTYEV